MPHKLPKQLAKFAAPLARVNPSAYADEDTARRALAEAYDRLKSDPDTMSVSTGGFHMRKDGEGYIELWVLPTLAFPEVDGVWWAE